MAAERGRWTFTLRGVLLLLLLATIPLALLGRLYINLRRAESAAAQLAQKHVSIAPDAVSPGVERLVRRAAGLSEASPSSIAGGADVTDDDLRALGDLPNLEVVELIGASITDAGLAPIGRLRKLKALYLGGTNIGDAGLVHLRNLPELIEFHLQDTRVTNAGLVHLATMPKLQTVWLARTGVDDAGVEEFHRLRPDVLLFIR